ncbi:MAG: hypothetical protein GX139_10620 [Armatimonadetes bacterium]|jgi:hypothetical protein|nr:hypothetical protein [Armatimonadota bacterium]
MSENKKAQTIVHLSDVLRLLPYLIAWGLVSTIRKLRLLGPWERAAVLAVAAASWFTFDLWRTQRSRPTAERVSLPKLAAVCAIICALAVPVFWLLVR